MYKTAALVLFGISLCANNYNNGFNCTLGTDVLCSQCNLDTSTCQVCNNGYVDPKYGNCKLPFRQMDNCNSYSSYNMCQSCNSGFGVQLRGTCSTTSSSLTANSTCYSATNGTCTYCANMLYVPDAQGNCGTVMCTIERCSLCTASDTCNLCIDGHTLVQGQCMESTAGTPLENCMMADEPSSCTRCNTGYFVSGGACISTTSSLAAEIIRSGTEFLASGAFPAPKPAAGVLTR